LHESKEAVSKIIGGEVVFLKAQSQSLA